MAEFLNGLKRTDMCGTLALSDAGRAVTVMGWINRRRDLGGLIFVQIRDRSGIVQAVFDTDNEELLKKAAELKLEYVVSVKGTVRPRLGDNVNPDMKTGEIEISASELLILSEAETTPFSVGNENSAEALRMKYRYLDLRNERLQKNLAIRSKICGIVRNFLSDNGFLEIETPCLGRSTPEGARDYLVPSRIKKGSFYALPQSPQLYKQLLMIAGLDRYFQIARCFRDEDLRANRQPEFTQIDLEMSFVDREEEVTDIMEKLVVKLFDEVKGIKIPEPFMRLTYAEAMERFGSDKPDLRFGMEIKDVKDAVKGCGFAVFENALANGGSVKCIVAENACDNFSRKELDRLSEFVKTFKAKGLAWYGKGKEGVKSSFAKFMTEESLAALEKVSGMKDGDMLFVVSDLSYDITVTALGELRNKLAKELGIIGAEYKVLWITDFPLFEYSEEEGRYVAKHHPFTSPKNEDLPLIKTHPEKARAKAYDLVINGDEMGGGSMRIYNREVQELMFEALGFTPEQIRERFGFFVDAFKFGTPPHGGLAFGLDRLVMLFADTDNIKDVIAFPKMQNANCLMTEAPSPVENKQLDELAIKLAADGDNVL